MSWERSSWLDRLLVLAYQTESFLVVTYYELVRWGDLANDTVGLCWKVLSF